MMDTLREFQALQFHPADMDMCKVILRLLDKPTFGAATKDRRESDGHLRRDAALSVYQFRKRRACYSECGGCCGDAQTQRLDTLTQHEAAGMRGIFHRHGM